MQFQLFDEPARLELDWRGRIAREEAARARRRDLQAGRVQLRARRAEIAIVASSLLIDDYARRALQVLAPGDVGDPLWRAVFQVIAVTQPAGVSCSMPLLCVALASDHGILLFDDGAWIREVACRAWLQRESIDIERYAALVRAARRRAA